MNCAYNAFHIIDVTKNIELDFLDCEANHLTYLDLTNNNALLTLICGKNELTDLNISQNTSLENLFINDMSSINKVCVWGLPFPPLGLALDSINSPIVYFTTNCSK